MQGLANEVENFENFQSFNLCSTKLYKLPVVNQQIWTTKDSGGRDSPKSF